MPSRSIEVRRISPAPSPSISRAQSTGSRPVSRVPERAHTRGRPSASRRTSIDTTTACAPNSLDAPRNTCGLRSSASGVEDDLFSLPGLSMRPRLDRGADAAAVGERHEAFVGDASATRSRSVAVPQRRLMSRNASSSTSFSLKILTAFVGSPMYVERPNCDGLHQAPRRGEESRE